MKTCIYCKRNDTETPFKSKEHVIPQSFGRYGTDTPTLDCVCDECNNYFGRELDQALARDTWEGIMRYKKGILSSEHRPLKRVKLSISEGDEAGLLGGVVLDGVDGTTGKTSLPAPQFHIRNKQSGEMEIYLIDEIKNFKVDDEIHGEEGSRETKVFGPSQEDHDAVIEELKRNGFNFKIKGRIIPPFLEGKNDGDEIIIPVTVEGTVDQVIKRAYCKSLFNFIAYYDLANDIMGSEWDEIRDFIRNGNGTVNGRMLNSPFWGEESEEMRFMDDSCNVLAENLDKGVSAKIQFYNLYTYEFIMSDQQALKAEKAVRFTAGQEPFLGEKRSV